MPSVPSVEDVPELDIRHGWQNWKIRQPVADDVGPHLRKAVKEVDIMSELLKELNGQEIILILLLWFLFVWLSGCGRGHDWTLSDFEPVRDDGTIVLWEWWLVDMGDATICVVEESIFDTDAPDRVLLQHVEVPTKWLNRDIGEEVWLIEFELADVDRVV